MLAFVLATREPRPRQRLELVPPAKPVIPFFWAIEGTPCCTTTPRKGKKIVWGPTGNLEVSFGTFWLS